MAFRIGREFKASQQGMAKQKDAYTFFFLFFLKPSPRPHPTLVSRVAPPAHLSSDAGEGVHGLCMGLGQGFQNLGCLCIQYDEAASLAAYPDLVAPRFGGRAGLASIPKHRPGGGEGAPPQEEVGREGT